jgi:hypothetical protein
LFDKRIRIGLYSDLWQRKRWLENPGKDGISEVSGLFKKEEKRS